MHLHTENGRSPSKARTDVKQAGAPLDPHKDQPCWHLNFKLLASRTVRLEVSVSSSPVGSTLLTAALAFESDTGGNRPILAYGSALTTSSGNWGHCWSLLKPRSVCEVDAADLVMVQPLIFCAESVEWDRFCSHGHRTFSLYALPVGTGVPRSLETKTAPQKVPRRKAFLNDNSRGEKTKAYSQDCGLFISNTVWKCKKKSSTVSFPCPQITHPRNEPTANRKHTKKLCNC